MGLIKKMKLNQEINTKIGKENVLLKKQIFDIEDKIILLKKEKSINQAHKSVDDKKVFLAYTKDVKSACLTIDLANELQREIKNMENQINNGKFLNLNKLESKYKEYIELSNKIVKLSKKIVKSIKKMYFVLKNAINKTPFDFYKLYMLNFDFNAFSDFLVTWKKQIKIYQHKLEYLNKNLNEITKEI